MVVAQIVHACCLKLFCLKLCINETIPFNDYRIQVIYGEHLEELLAHKMAPIFLDDCLVLLLYSLLFYFLFAGGC